MRKQILSVILGAALTLGLATAANAEHYTGGDNWSVKFTADAEMDSTFHSSDLSEGMAGLQPGDDIVFTVTLKNEYPSATNWWMTNEILHSLEESVEAAAAGGAYTYELTYTSAAGHDIVLFSSDTVGGDEASPNGEGLYEINGALNDFFFLDTLEEGQTGRVTLLVALDGETQGNDYQDTRADLQLNFAVELTSAPPAEDTPWTEDAPEPEPTSTPNDPDATPEPLKPGDTIKIETPRPTATPRPNTPTPGQPGQPSNSFVRTGDDTDLKPLYIAMAVSGALFLLLGILSLRLRRKEEKK